MIICKIKKEREIKIYYPSERYYSCKGRDMPFKKVTINLKENLVSRFEVDEKKIKIVQDDANFYKLESDKLWYGIFPDLKLNYKILIYHLSDEIEAEKENRLAEESELSGIEGYVSLSKCEIIWYYLWHKLDFKVVINVLKGIWEIWKDNKKQNDKN